MVDFNDPLAQGIPQALQDQVAGTNWEAEGVSQLQGGQGMLSAMGLGEVGASIGAGVGEQTLGDAQSFYSDLGARLGTSAGTDYAALARTHGDAYAAQTMKAIYGEEGVYGGSGGGGASGVGAGATGHQAGPDWSAPSGSSGGGGGGGAGTASPIVRREGGTGAQAQTSGGLGLGSLLSLGSSLFKTPQPIQQQGQQGSGISPITQSPGVLSNQQAQGTGSFAGLITNRQPLTGTQGQGAGQPINDAVQQSMQQFAVGGAGSSATPAFQSATGRSAGGSGGSSFQGAAMAPFQASPEQVQQAANQQATGQQAPLQDIGLSDLGRGALLGGAAGGAIGGIPAVGEQPGVGAFGQQLPGVEAAGVATGMAPGTTPEGMPTIDQPDQLEDVAEKDTFKTIIDPDDKSNTIRVSGPKKSELANTIDPDDAIEAGRKALTEPSNEQLAEQAEAKRARRAQLSQPFTLGKKLDVGKLGREPKSPIVDSFKQGVKRSMVTAGGAIMSPFRSQKERDMVERKLQSEEEALKEEYKDSPTQVAIGGMAGKLAPYAISPGTGAVRGGSFLAKTLYNAIKGTATGSAYGATQYAPSGTERIKNTLLAGGMGMAARAILPILGKAAISPEAAGALAGAGVGAIAGGKEGAAYGAGAGLALGHAARRGFSPKFIAKQRAKKIAKADVTPKRTKELEEAAKREGFKLSDSEKLRSATFSKAEGRLTPSEEAIEDISKQTLKTEAKVLGKIKQNIKSVLPKGSSVEKVDAAVKKAYERISNKQVSKGTAEELAKKENDYIRTFMKDAMGPKVSKASTYPKGSAGRLIETEKHLKNLVSKKEGVGRESEAIKQIQGLLDKEFTSYSRARKLSQKSIVFKKKMKALEEVKTLAGKERPTSAQVYDKFFGSPKQRKLYMDDIKAAGGNVQQAKDLGNILNSLSNSSFAKLAGKDPRLMSDFSSSQGLGAITSTLRKVFLKKHDSVLVKLQTNPNYAAKVASMSKLGEKTQGLKDLLSQVGALEATDVSLKDYDVPTDPKIGGEIKSQVTNFTDPDNAPESVKKVHADTPMMNQVPGAVSKAIVSNAKDDKAKKIADKIMLMSPKKFSAYSSTLKGREDLIGIAKKYGKPGDAEKLQQMFRHQDGAKGVTPTTVMGAVEEKLRQGQKPAATAKGRAVQARAAAAKGKVAEKLTPHEEMLAKLKKRDILAKRQSLGRRRMIVPGTSKKERAAAASPNSFSARLMSLILSHLLKNSRVKALLGSSGFEGKVANLALSRIRAKARGEK